MHPDLVIEAGNQVADVGVAAQFRLHDEYEKYLAEVGDVPVLLLKFFESIHAVFPDQS
jgi:hypothetical protein